VFIFLSDRVSEGSVYGGSVTVQASLPFKHVTDTTDGGPSTDFHLGPSDIVPLFQNSADQHGEVQLVRNIRRDYCLYTCLYWCLMFCCTLFSCLISKCCHNMNRAPGM
jgi:hypothetical protein